MLQWFLALQTVTLFGCILLHFYFTLNNDGEFKAGAVKMVAEKGRKISAVANDLGVSEPALRRWVKASTEPEDATAKRLAELEAENKKIKKQLENANDTVEVLKKSVAIFIKPQN